MAAWYMECDRLSKRKVAIKKKVFELALERGRATAALRIGDAVRARCQIFKLMDEYYNVHCDIVRVTKGHNVAVVPSLVAQHKKHAV